jgi:DNA processing protein
MDQDRLSFLALHFIPGIGDRLVKQLVSYCGSSEKVFKTPKGKLLKIPGIGPIAAESILQGAAFDLAEKELKKAEREETEILFYTDKKYPARLKQIEDAPSMIYFKGQANLNHHKSIAIVGTRQATEYGKEIVTEVIERLTPHAPLIVSGLAYGIDIQAHKQALKYDLPTLGVLGSGIDVIYPAVHKDTAKKMLAQGGLLSENPFGTKPDAHHFPARNRIIAGLCDALIVVEAAEKGGALITAEIANSYNKDVFAIPGSLGLTYSEGCNKLIRDNKAIIYTSVTDIELALGWTKEGVSSSKEASVNLDMLDEDERMIVQLLLARNVPVMIDDLAYQSGLSASKLASLLLTLEFKNLVKTFPGKMFGLAKGGFNKALM